MIKVTLKLVVDASCLVFPVSRTVVPSATSHSSSGVAFLFLAPCAPSHPPLLHRRSFAHPPLMLKTYPFVRSHEYDVREMDESCLEADAISIIARISQILLHSAERVRILLVSRARLSFSRPFLMLVLVFDGVYSFMFGFACVGPFPSIRPV